MIRNEIIIAGFGGQGVIFAGELLATAAMKEGLNVTLFPAYGPEMRGGTANCIVIVASQEVFSPVVQRPDILIALNQPSLEKFEPLVKSAGLILYNSSLVNIQPKRNDITYFPIKASDIAISMGDLRVANVVAVGALIGKTKLLNINSLEQAIAIKLGGKKPGLIDLNQKALRQGEKEGMKFEQVESQPTSPRKKSKNK